MGLINRNGIVAGWGAAGDRHVIVTSTSYEPNKKPGVIYAPAYGAGAANVLGSQLIRQLGLWGYPVVCVDMGAARTGGVTGAASVWLGDTVKLHQWTNDLAMGAVDAIDATIMPAIGGLSPYFVYAGSGGGAIAKWVHDNPAKVRAYLGIIAVTSLQDVVTRDPATASAPPTFKDSIKTALGMVDDVVPAVRDPLQMASTWPTSIPVRHYLSGQDHICAPQKTKDFCDIVNGIGGHAEWFQHNNNDHDYVTGLPVETAAGWLVSH